MILLDTHALVWADSDDRRLGRKARTLIERHWREGKVNVASITFWEVALLQSRGRLSLPECDQSGKKSLTPSDDSPAPRGRAPVPAPAARADLESGGHRSIPELAPTNALGTRPTSQGMLRLIAPVCQCSETR